jgi:hypothetical protein
MFVTYEVYVAASQAVKALADMNTNKFNTLVTRSLYIYVMYDILHHVVFHHEGTSSVTKHNCYL